MLASRRGASLVYYLISNMFDIHFYSPLTHVRVKSSFAFSICYASMCFSSFLKNPRCIFDLQLVSKVQKSQKIRWNLNCRPLGCCESTLPPDHGNHQQIKLLIWFEKRQHKNWFNIYSDNFVNRGIFQLIKTFLL